MKKFKSLSIALGVILTIPGCILWIAGNNKLEMASTGLILTGIGAYLLLFGFYLQWRENKSFRK